MQKKTGEQHYSSSAIVHAHLKIGSSLPDMLNRATKRRRSSGTSCSMWMNRLPSPLSSDDAPCCCCALPDR